MLGLGGSVSRKRCLLDGHAGEANGPHGTLVHRIEKHCDTFFFLSDVILTRGRLPPGQQ